MRRLLGYAETGDTVVVWRIDRLGRSLVDVLNTVNGLRDAGINARSLSDGINPATSTGRLMLNILATLAEDERNSSSNASPPASVPPEKPAHASDTRNPARLLWARSSRSPLTIPRCTASS